MNSRASARCVLHVRSSAGLYGADRMVLALNGALAQHGIKSRLLCINNYRMEEQALHSAARALGQSAELLPCSGRLDLGTVRALATQIDADDSVVLHAHDYKSAFYSWMAARGRDASLVATLHGQVEHTRALRFYNRIELALLRRFDALAVVSGAQVGSLVKAGIPATRLHHVENGIDLAGALGDIAPVSRASLGLPPAGFLFAAVARIAPEKNLPALLKAFQGIALINSDARLLIVGDGPDRKSLQESSSRLGLEERVQFAGQRDDMQRIYPLIDCLVLPSLSEGMPLVVIEAMAFAIPVIASSVGDIPRLLAGSACGQLVPADDVDALRTAMLAALEEPAQRDHTARQFVLQKHSAEAMAERYLTIYESLWTRTHARKAS